MASIFCTSCGSTIPENSRFCTSCGTAIKATAPSISPVIPVVKDDVKQEAAQEVIAQETSGKSSIKLILVILLLLVVICATCFVFWNSSSENKEVSKAREQKRLDSIATVEKIKLDSMAAIAAEAAYRAAEAEAAALAAKSQKVQANTNSQSQLTLSKTLTILGQDDVNLRQSPGVFAAKLGKLKTGKVCTVIKRGQQETIDGKTDFWYNVNCNGTNGWVFGEFTSLKN